MVLMAQWINHYEQSLYSFESDLLPQAVLTAFENFTLAFLNTPGGSEFWEDMGHVFGADVGQRIDSLLADATRQPLPITETYPWFRAN